MKKNQLKENTNDIIRRAIRTLDPKEIAIGTCRAEADEATPEELRLYRKGAEAMLRNFADGDFVIDVINAFDDIYKDKK